jgi:hypothetical protein
MFDCPDTGRRVLKREIGAFEIGDLVVAFISKQPVFGIITRYHEAEYTVGILEHENAELLDLIDATKEARLDVTANDYFVAGDGQFAIIPLATSSIVMKVRINEQGFWNKHRTYFALYDSNKLYLKNYTVKEISTILKNSQNAN